MNKLVIIGKRNVGKSSLFNLLTNNLEAVSIDYSGYTRDCKHSFTKIYSKGYEIIDTPGIGYFFDNLDILSIKKTWNIIKNANFVIFLLDIFDIEDDLFLNIVTMLKKSNKNVFYALNKIDLISNEDILSLKSKFFFIKIFFISVKHKIGIFDLLKHIDMFNFTNTLYDIKIKNTFKISIIGKQNVGKSLLSNRFVNDNKSIVYDYPGTTRDVLQTYFIKNNHSYLILDTPGIKTKKKILRQIDKVSIDKTFFSLKKSDMCLIILDVNDIFNKQNVLIIKRVLKLCKFKLILLNKSDTINKKKMILIEKNIKTKFSFLLNVNYQFISAKYLFGIEQLIFRIEHSKNVQKYLLFDNILLSIKNYINSKDIVTKLCLTIRKIFIKKINSFNIIIYLNSKNVCDSYKKFLCVLIVKYINLKNFSFKFSFR